MAKAFFENALYEFVLIDGKRKTGRIHNETKLSTNGIPMVIVLHNQGITVPMDYIPWHSVVSYRKVG